MRLSDRYLFGELIMPFVIGTLAVLMMLVGNTLYAILPDLVQKHLPIMQVLRICVLNIPVVLVMTLPVSTALAASLAVNRMARDQEITVLRSAGLPLFRAFLPIMFFGLLVSVADLYVSDRVVPWAWREQQNVEQLLNNLPTNPVDIGLTVRVEDYTIAFNSAQKITDTKRQLNQVTIIENPKPGITDYPVITTAQSADYENGTWTLHNVVTHKYDKTGTTQFDAVSPTATLSLRIDFSGMYNGQSQFSNFGAPLSFAELTQKAIDAKRFGNLRDATNFEVERWFKLTLPLMCLVFSICAPPLALRFSRAGAFTGVLLSIITVFVAWNTLILIKIVALGNFVPPILAAWTTDALFTILGLWLLKNQE